MKQLLQLIRDRGLTDKAEDAETKAQLIAVLVAAASSSSSSSSSSSKPDYQSMKMADLLKLAAERGIEEAEDAETRVEVALMLEADDEARAAVDATATVPDDDFDVELTKKTTMAQVRASVAQRAGDTLQRTKRNETLRRSFGKGLTLTPSDIAMIQEAMSDDEIRRSMSDGGTGTADAGLLWTEVDDQDDDVTPAAAAAPATISTKAPSLEQRAALIEALLARERLYVDSLYALDKLYLASLLKAARADRAMRAALAAADPRRAFLQLHGAVQLLNERHGMLAEQIDDCTAENGSIAAARIGTLFGDVTEMLLLYGVFVAQEADALAALQECQKANNGVVRLLADVQVANNVAPMADLLRAPIEHVRNYLVLLRDILNHTPRTHDDYADLVDAIDLCQRELDDIEDARNAANEHIKELRTPVVAAAPRRPAAPIAKIVARGGVQINVNQTVRQAAAEVLQLDVMREDVLRRHACSYRDTAGEAILTERRLAFVGVSGRDAGAVFTIQLRDASAPRLGTEGVIDVVSDTTTLRLDKFKSVELRDDFFEQIAYVHECMASGQPVLYHFAVEGKFLDTGPTGSRRDLTPCLLRVTTSLVEIRFTNGRRPRTHELRHIRRWGHNGVRLSIVLGDSADHVRIATKSERDADDVTQFLTFITQRVAFLIKQQQQQQQQQQQK
jgi:hypothetical protein